MTQQEFYNRLAEKIQDDPVKWVRLLWPDINLYDKEGQIIRSVWYNDETIVPAGHMLGKDFTAAIVCLVFFLSRHPCRIMTTSVDEPQLEGVLWGEIKHRIQTSRIPLDRERGGPLVVTHLDIRKVVNGQVCGLSYLRGRVARKGEGMSGHHIPQTGDGIPRTLFVGDEYSGVDDVTYDKASEWANRILILGNPYECDNQFRWAVHGKPGTDDRGGDVPRENGEGYRRKIIQIKAEDSPNVKHAMMQRESGLEPTNEILVPGVLPWSEYVKRRATWDAWKQTVGLDAEWYEGAENRLFPKDVLEQAKEIARRLPSRRYGLAMGIDTAEGGDSTCWAVVDGKGLIELVSKKTPDTNVIPGETLALMRQFGVEPRKVCFDAGGGGKQHADRLRGMGYACQTVRFGEAVSLEPKRSMTLHQERVDIREERYVYVNRRAELFGELSLLVAEGFGIPAQYAELHRQLALIPYEYDSEGRMRLPPKQKRRPDSKEKTLCDIIGNSPDEADALAVAAYAMRQRSRRATAGIG